MKRTINMMSKADMTKGHGVLSAYEEQVTLVKENLSDQYEVTVNSRHRADIMHYHTFNLEYWLALPMVKMKSTTLGYVHTLPETLDQSIRLPGFARKAFYWYVIRFYKSMDYLVTVNPYFIDRLETHGIPREKVSYIPNYVSQDQFYPMSAAEKGAARDKMGIGREKFVVMCAGQLQERKGIFDFVRLAKALPDVEFVWVGGFSFGIISSGYERIKAIAENPPPNLHFTGMVEREEMNAYYNAADLFLLPSFEELFPMTVLEAMCCHVPVLLRDLDIYKNILFDFYLKADDVDGFTSVIQRLRSDPAYVRQSQQDSERGNRFYAKENVVKMWRNLYGRMIMESQLASNPEPRRWTKN